LIPITRNTAIISKKVKQISKEIKIEQDRINVLSDFAKNFDLDEFADRASYNGDYLSVWMKEAKKIQMDQAKKKEIVISGKKHDDEEVIVLEEERDVLKVYSSYGWEVQNINPAKADPIDVLRYLSKFEGMNFDIKDDFGRTPLHYAACVGAFTCTSMLIEKKVDINAVDTDNVRI
jgi:ankyrin repeat protein